eukprot:4353359-Amphidinium_carterae.2
MLPHYHRACMCKPDYMGLRLLPDDPLQNDNALLHGTLAHHNTGQRITKGDGLRVTCQPQVL